MSRAKAGRGARGLKTGVYTAVNEDFRAPINKVMPSAVVLHQPVREPNNEAAMTKNTITDAEQRMNKSVDALKHELGSIRTGRAHTSLLEHIKVSYYGSDVPLNQVANITVQDARTLSISAWDKKAVPGIEKAILNSDLGLNPVTAGEVIRVPLPPLNEERRKELIKVVRAEGEKARVAIRNIRRDAIHAFKEMIKDKTIAQDEEHRSEEKIQKMTDAHIASVDKILEAKEKEIMEV
jgi:ribosome recycling factor